MLPVQEVPVADSQEPVVFRERSRSRDECRGHSPGNVKGDPHLTAKWRCGGSGGAEGFPGQLLPGAWMWNVDTEDEEPRLEVSLVPFFKLPVRVTGVDPVLFRQLGEALETVGRFACGPSSGVNEFGEPAD